MFILALIGTIVSNKNGYPNRNFKIELDLQNLKKRTNNFEKGFFMNGLDSLEKGTSFPIIGNIKKEPCFLTWGDSHIANLYTGFNTLALKNNISGIQIARQGIKPLIGFNTHNTFNTIETNTYNQSVLKFIDANPNLKTIIIGGMWGKEDNLIHTNGEGLTNETYVHKLRIGLTNTVNSILKMKRNVILVSDIPWISGDPYQILFISNKFNLDVNYNKIKTTRDNYNFVNKDILVVLNDLSKKTNVTIIHPENLFFNKENICIIENNHHLLFSDSHHLTKEGSDFIIPAFEVLFSKIK
jgi:hypothetical protein